MKIPNKKSLFEIKLEDLKANKEQIYALMQQEASDPETIAYYEQQAKELGDTDLQIMERLNVKISIDYDSTLDRGDVQEVVTDLVKKGYNVYIVTSRQCTETALKLGHHWVERQNSDLYAVADKCGIKRENIIFTEHVDKIVYLKDKGFLFHLDDDVDELIKISESGDSCKPLNVDHMDWKHSIYDILKNK